MRQYVCTCGFSINLVDDNGNSKGKHLEIPKGTLWERSDSKLNFPGVPASVRLHGRGTMNGTWVEILEERLELYFEKVEPLNPAEVYIR